jgi:hypothetical protein
VISNLRFTAVGLLAILVAAGSGVAFVRNGGSGGAERSGGAGG